MKVACTVREEAVGKGLTQVSTSLAAYFNPNARRNGRDRGKDCREPCLDQRRIDVEKSHKTLLRIERLRQLNSTTDWVNDDLYRLMYKEDLYVIAYERIKSKPGNMTAGADGITMDGFSLEAIQEIIRAMRTEQFHVKPVRTA